MTQTFTTLTNEQKRAKILAGAATRRGAPDSLYFSVAKELREEGLIALDFVYTTGGNQAPRWFLTEKGRAH
jgi:hypothetical protein